MNLRKYVVKNELCVKYYRHANIPLTYLVSCFILVLISLFFLLINENFHNLKLVLFFTSIALFVSLQVVNGQRCIIQFEEKIISCVGRKVNFSDIKSINKKPILKTFRSSWVQWYELSVNTVNGENFILFESSDEELIKEEMNFLNVLFFNKKN